MECSVCGTEFAYPKANRKKGVTQLFTASRFIVSARILLGNLFLVGNAVDLL